MIKPLPFQVQREVPVSLSTQIADGVRRAISDGYYQAGERLPNLDEMASDLQVARQTVRVAVGHLARRGTVVSRRKSGIVVADAGSQSFLHHLLHVTRGGTSYYFSTRNASLARVLAEKRIRYTPIGLPHSELIAGMPHIREVLEGNAVGLVVIDGITDHVRDLCMQHEVPYLHVAEGADDRSMAQISTNNIAEVELADYAWRQGVRRVGLVCNDSPRKTLAAAFQAAGIEIEHIVAVCDQALESPQAMELAGYTCVRDRLAASAPLPDLLYFIDDYLGRGGLTALLAAGIRVPQDLRVATHANLGHVPVFPVSLTRIEVDPVAEGRILAETVLTLLRTGRRLPAPVAIAHRLIIGETL